MSDVLCPVHAMILNLSGKIDSGVLTDPKARRISEQILRLLEDIASGRGDSHHLEALDSLVEEYLQEKSTPVSQATGAEIKAALEKDRETFVSHIESRNCPTADCITISPSPCQMACPAGIDVPTYLTLIGQGRDAEAIEVIRRDNPLPWVCGLVCTKPCEMMCVRGRIDTPVSIKTLKAFAAEKAMSDRNYRNPEKKPPNDRRICVVGAGPGGLSASYYLALMGYSVTVIEALPMAGGMLMVGIPRYRLPREVIDREVAMIEDLGVEFRYNTRFGKDVTFEGLKHDGFEAFFFAIGAHKSYKLGIKGEGDFPGVIDAVEFLRSVALGNRHSPGRHVIVIGGGNVAIDAARTSLRLGADTVTIAYRRTEAEMPADPEEVEQAMEEGVNFSFLTIPTQVVGTGSSVEGLACLRAELIQKKDSDRFHPVPVLGSDHTMAADAVISAIGQQVDTAGFESLTGLNWTRRGTIEVRQASMETTMPGVFAAGDAVTGPATVIEAIGGGKRAAEAIDRHLNNIPQPRMPKVPVRYRKEIPLEIPAETKMTLKRPEMGMLNLERRRTTFQQAELGYTENQVREEARRCLRCDICRRCGKCVDICQNKMGIGALTLGYMDFDSPGKTDFRDTMGKCITCGACAANCPNHAIVIQEKGNERILNLCGTILNRQKIQYCEMCKKAMGPESYTRFIRKRTRTVSDTSHTGRICEACLRQDTAAAWNV
ncbi:MAG: NAD(P)-binding protein [Pseudomonadota bacterium]